MRIKRGLMILAILLLGGAANMAKAQKQNQRPNVLFAILDDVTYQQMGAYGCSWVKTPNFDRVAKDGLLFKRAYTANAKCAPSRSCIITGRNSWQLEDAGNHWSYFPSKFGSLAETLAQNGYSVGYTGKGVAPVVAKKADGTPRDILVKSYQTLTTTPPSSQMSNTDYAANFGTFLKDAGNKPFFFWYGGWEAHREYEFKSGIKGGKKLSDIPDGDIYPFFPKSDSVKADLLDYAYEIEYFDKHLGKMLDQLEQTGQLHNTLVVVTSDNGMPFPRVKGQAYEYSNHLPLAVMWADGIKRPGRKIDDVISFIDFAPTILEVANVKNIAPMQAITGKSFADIFKTTKDGWVSEKRDWVVYGKERHDVGRPKDAGYPIRALMKKNFLYIKNYEIDRWPSGDPITGYLNVDGGPTKTACLNTVYSTTDDFNFWLWSFGKRPAEELYNIEKDPNCMTNLASDANYKSKLEEMGKQLVAKLTAQKDPRMFGKGYLFDQYEYADKRGVNFYDRYMAKDPKLKWGWVSNSDFQDISNIKRANTARNK